MPAPANNDELLDFVAKSGVVEDVRLRSYVARLAEQPGTLPANPEGLAAALVRDGIITSFQAEHLLQGKWKRFFLGKYKVLEKLGTGGMGTVFLCEHKVMKRRVAVKVLPAAKAQDQASLQRFYREARAVAAVDHPNLVRAYDIDEDEGLHFLVMEFVDGINLQDLVKKFGQLDLLRACHYMYGSAVGLHHASEMGLVHRDIKPANILVERTGVVKILDMGLARFFNPDEDDLLTKKFDENVLGTADYLAPEQAIDSSTVDIRADIYGLGGTFYFLLIGHPPFPDGTVAQKLLWHQTKTPKPVMELRPDVPAEISNLIARMMAKDLVDRVQSPAELIAALTPWVQTAIPPPPDREMPTLSLAAQGGPSQVARTAAGSTVASNPGGVAYSQPSVVPGTSRSDILREKAAAAARSAATAIPAEPPKTGPPAVAMPQPVSSKISRPSPSATFAPPAAIATTTAPSPEAMVWESATTADTMLNAHADTSRNPGDKQDSDVVRRKTSKSQVKKKKNTFPTPWVIGTAVLAVILAASAAIYMFTRGARTIDTQPTEIAPKEVKRWIVSSSGSGDQKLVKRTLADAVSAAGPGDTIAIDGDIQSAPIFISGAGKKNLHIEPAATTGIVKITFKPDASSKRATLIELNSVEGVSLSRLTLDLAGNMDVGVMIAGKCPDVKLEDVSVLNPKVSGFRLQLAVGEPERPIRLSRFRVASDKPYENGVHCFTNRDTLPTAHVRISAGRLEGAKIGIRIEGSCKDIEVTQTRFFKHAFGVHVFGPQNGEFGFKVERCTFAEISNQALLLDAGIGGINQDLTINKNYFAETKNLVEVGKDNEGKAAVSNGIKAAENSRDAGSAEGNVPIAAEVVNPPPVLNKNPAEVNFLKPTPPGRGAD